MPASQHNNDDAQEQWDELLEVQRRRLEKTFHCYDDEGCFAPGAKVRL